MVVVNVFFSSYLIDILLPMNVYLLFQIALRPKMKLQLALFIGFLSTFLIGLFVEFSQYFDYPVFGSTYDPVDIVMYFLGAVGGLLFDFLIIQPVEKKNKL
jgi:uncharacterized membrane protein